jgi:hypothetical protein
MALAPLTMFFCSNLLMPSISASISLCDFDAGLFSARKQNMRGLNALIVLPVSPTTETRIALLKSQIDLIR